MPAIPLCNQCGGKEFYVESGFYVCAECQVLSQDVRELGFAEDRGGGFTLGQRKKQYKPASQSQETKVDSGKPVTSWEVLNLVLKGLLDELVSLGCDPKLKIVALQIWCRYLKELEVAFISCGVSKKPRLGLTFRAKDAELVYGVSSQYASTCQSLFFRSAPRSLASSQSSRHKRKRADIARSIYEESIGSKSSGDVTLSGSSKQSHKVRYSCRTKAMLDKLYEGSTGLGDKEEGRKMMRREMKSFRHSTLGSIVAIINLAVLMQAQPLAISDLIRWSREGYLSLNRAEHLLPSTVQVAGDIKSLFTNTHYSWQIMMTQVAELVRTLNIPPPRVDLALLSEKFILSLHLPVDLLEPIKDFLKVYPPAVRLKSSSNFEGRALALILLVMKRAFSLDDSTEIAISEALKKINSCQEVEEKLFVWSDWVKQTVCSQAVLSLHHCVYREQLYPGSNVGSSKPFIGQWLNAPKKQTINRAREMPASVVESLERLMAPLCEQGVAPLNPTVSYTDQLVDRQPQRVRDCFPPPPHARGLFTPLLDYSRMNELAQIAGIPLVKGTKQEFEKIQKVKWKTETPRSRRHCATQLTTLVNTDSDSDRETGGNTRQRVSDLKQKPDPGENLAFRVSLEPEEFQEEPVLYFPSFNYWMIHGAFHRCRWNISEFDEYAKEHFPSSFYFLLRQCALVGQQSLRDVYQELMLVESIFCKRKNDTRLRNLLERW